MRVFITQLDTPPPVPAAVATGISAQPGGQAAATALTAKCNIVTNVAAGTGVQLTVLVGQRQRVWNAGGNTLLVFPPLNTAFLGSGTNVAVTLASLATNEWTFDGVSTWYVSP
jgi:hypothetical protein